MMHRIKIILACAWLAVAAVSSAEEAARRDFQQGRLDNGLTVLTMEQHRAPIACVQVWYHVGSKDEDPLRQGFAHMFEHMMFRGSDRIGPQDHFKYLQRYGSRVNGYTSFDRTVYFETVPISQLDLALWLEAERMGRLVIDEEGFAAEREVVKEERRMRYLNRPYGRLFETMMDAAFNVHPYRWTPIGNLEHLNAATTEELREFFSRYYRPNNATLIVVGDVTHAEVMAKAQQYLGGIERGPEPPRVKVVEPPIEEARRVEITDRAPSPRVVLAYHAPSARDLDSIPVNVLRRILSDGQSSRLYRRLVLQRELAVEVWAHDYALEQAGLLMVSATLKPDVDVAEGEAALREELQRLVTGGIEPSELSKARNQAVADFVRQGSTVRGLAEQLGEAAVILGDPNRVNTDLARLREVTAEEVMDIARRVLNDEQSVTVIIRPDEQARPDEDVADKSEDDPEAVTDRSPPQEMPTGRSPQPTHLPFPSLRRLDNGLRVVVFDDHTVPAVHVSLRLLTGAKHDRTDQPGLARVTADTLRRGTQRHTGDELAEIIDFHAMSLTTSVGHEETTAAIWSLSEHLPLAVEMLAEIVQEPVFPEKEVNSFTARAAAQAAIEEENPSVIASRTLDRLLYESHFLARPADGTSASLRTITPEDVAGFHRRFYTPDVATLMFAGDVTIDDVFTLAEEWFGEWEGRTEHIDSPLPPLRNRGEVALVNRDDAVQSEIRIGQRVDLTRQDRDYAAARLLGQIFGGSFSSRLNRTLRIEKGLTYGSRAYFEVEVETAAFKLGTFTRTGRTAEAVEAALAELRRLQSGDITREELDAARDQLIGEFQLGLETPAQIADAWWNLVVWELPEGWYYDYLRSVDRVGGPDVLNDVAKRVIDPARMTIVVVGDASRTEPSLEPIAPVRRLAP